MGQTAGYVAIMIAVGSIFFEVSKIKINPISFLLKWIGKRMFEPMNSRLDAVERRLTKMRLTVSAGRFLNLRTPVEMGSGTRRMNLATSFRRTTSITRFFRFTA